MQRQHKGAKKENLWIVTGDIHGHAENLARISELEQASAIIISGDLTQNGGIAKAAEVMDKIRETGLPVYAQIGNMDKPEIDAWLTEQGRNLHGRVYELTPGIAIFGIGGSTITPFHTPSEFSEASYADWLAAAWQKASAFPLQILVSHNPPKDTPCDMIGSGGHVGSAAVREFIEKNQPSVCVCGHIHEAKSRCRLGKTQVLNPGMLSEGGYIVIREKDGSLACELKSVN